MGALAGQQTLRSNGRKRVLDDALDLVPVDAVVQQHAEPPAVPDVRRPEETVGIRNDEELLVSQAVSSAGRP